MRLLFETCTRATRIRICNKFNRKWGDINLLKLTITTLSVCAGLVAVSPLAMAQIPQANVYFGLGTATADSNGHAIDPLGTGIFSSTPKLNGLFADAGGSLMLTPHFGAGAQISWRPAKVTTQLELPAVIL